MSSPEMATVRAPGCRLSFRNVAGPELRHYTIDSGCGRRAGSTFAVLTSASAEPHGDAAGNSVAKEN